MYEKELQLFGLSEKEALVYLAALESGPDTAQNIAKKSGINRPTTYVQIESLKRKGLMSEFLKGKKTYFTVEPPERLESLLNEYEKELSFKRAEVQRILPSLNQLFTRAEDRPKVRYFEGIEGIDAMHDDFLKSGAKEVDGIVNLDKLQAVTRQKKYAEDRITLGIKSRVIYANKAGPVEKASDPQKMREAKYVDFEINADLSVYNNKVSIMAYKDSPIGVIIESPEIASTLRGVFNALWEQI